ncbi:MAG: hypothetical protein NC548_05710 [Lachnospiraceae bacterium]|nr:hypothetical protein [Lachnospiraceae bacterium]
MIFDPKDYMIPAEEGAVWDALKPHLKTAGKSLLVGAGKTLRNFAIFVGAMAGLIVVACKVSDRNWKQYKERLANPTEEEKKSLKIFESSWVPELKKFHAQCKKDFLTWQRQNRNLNYGNTIVFDDAGIHYPTENARMASFSYGVSLLSFDYGSSAYNTDDPNDDRNGTREEPISEEIGQKLQQALKTLKPLIDRWKSESKKFSPWFELRIEYEDSDAYYPYVSVVLTCAHVDKDGIIKPNLPPYKK